ncbi:HYC_CC_PP family protein [Mangrovimonas cancribranchiae]|uniref:Secreted protein n=1 Tax=Mangrovimonas cancribranchiae TaxID=3080055 RepID=A0AAU6P4T8_9FLAO
MFHKIFSVALAVLVLFSTVSFTVEKHFCGDTLIDISVFTKAQKCDMEAFEAEQAAITKKHCCKDTIDFVKGQDQLTIKKFEDLELNQQLFLTAFTYSYLSVFEDLSRHTIPHKYYSPPNLVADIQVRDQVFLI